MAAALSIALALIALCHAKKPSVIGSDSVCYCGNDLAEDDINSASTIPSLWVFQQEKGIFLGQRSHSAVTILLLLAGDIEQCPGPCPRCNICKKVIRKNQSHGSCFACSGKSHIRCLVDKLEDGTERLYCRTCFQNTPQRDEDPQDTHQLYEDLNTFLNAKGIKIFHQNINGLLRKMDGVGILLKAVHHKIGIFGLSETHLHKDINSSEVNIDGYKFERSDRKNGTGGGVGCYVRDDISYHRRRDLEMEGVESLWIEIFQKNSRSILVCFLYRPPDTSKYLDESFEEKFDGMISTSVNENKETIVLGDINCDYLKRSSHPGIKSVFTRHGLKQIVKKPTRITRETSTLIDVIATSHEHNIKGLPCYKCGFWVHKRCDKISDVDYDAYSRVPKNQIRYVCLSCKSKANEFHLDQLPFADSSFTEPYSEDLNTSDVYVEEHVTDMDIWANFKKRGLHFLHLNVNGLLSKIEELRLIAQKTNAAVIGISETKIDKSVLDGEVNIAGYEIKRCDRNRHGGGVACYIRKDLAFNPREDFSPDIENVFLDIQLPKSKPILVGVLYRPPTASGFLDQLTLAISKTVDFDSQEVYILGDLNINLIHKSSDTSNGIKRYKEFCSHHGLKQIINSPTRVTDKSSSLLDHILTNSFPKISQHGVLDLGLSDHQLIYCTRKATRTKIHKHTFIKIRTFKNYAKQLFLDKLNKIKFPNYMEYENINAAYSHFVELITNIIDELAPVKEIRVRKDSQEWMDQEVLEGIRIRNKLLTKYRTSQIHSDYVNFKKARNRVQSLIKRKKKSFIIDKLKENIGKPKDLWKCLKSLGLSSGKDSSSKICLNNNGNPCFDDKTNAETFKAFFSNLASDLVKKLQRSPHRLDEVRKYYQHLNLTEPFSLAPTSLEKVLKLLEEINPSKATGLDNIAGKFLEDGATVLAGPITDLCNLSILLSTFPEGCKQAKLKPLFKKGSKGDPKNYRPISLLPQLSKSLKRLFMDKYKSTLMIIRFYIDTNLAFAHITQLILASPT